MDINKIHNEDCLEAMKLMNDNQFDLAIVDPPYGIGDFRQHQHSGNSIHKKIDWNNNIPSKEYFLELERVSKNRIIFGANYYGKYINDVGRIVHDKTGGGHRNIPKNMSSCDIASHSFGVNMKIFHFTYTSNVIGKHIDWDGVMRWHPCQKPVKLYEWLLMNYAKEGNKILDTHLGSGSIAIACHNLGYDLTGYELDKEYYDNSIKRIKNHQTQTRIF
jgi:site-specific DNA-methyltransferase (adenine-specific)